MYRLLSIALLLGLAACGNVPVIREITPNHAAPGAVVDVKGENFGLTRGKGFLTVGKVRVADGDVLVWTDTAVKMRVPVTAATGVGYIQLTTDGDQPSNKKKFTVDAAGGSVGSSLVVANQSTPGLEFFNLSAPGEPVLEVPLGDAGSATIINGLVASAVQQKLFVTLVRRDEAGEETGSLVVLGGAETGITVPTAVDVGVQPTGMALSTSENRLYVAATASGMLTVVSTIDNTVLGDVALDLSSVSYGFEPRQVKAFPAPGTDADPQQDWVAVAGNNWFLGRAEVVTYAPGSTQPIVSVIAVPGFELQAPIAVSTATGRLWLAGAMAGKAAVAALDVTAGTVLATAAFGDAIAVAGAAPTTATDVIVDPDFGKLFVALPGAGCAALDLTADGAFPAEAALFALPDALNMTQLSGDEHNLVVTRPAAGAVAKVSPDGVITADFVKTAPQPVAAVEFQAAQ